MPDPASSLHSQKLLDYRRKSFHRDIQTDSMKQHDLSLQRTESHPVGQGGSSTGTEHPVPHYLHSQEGILTVHILNMLTDSITRVTVWKL